MVRLKIPVNDRSPDTLSKIFNRLLTQLLECHGYRFDHSLNLNADAIDIELEGKHIVTELPFYAEFKYYGAPVNVTELQAFYGRYMTRWHKNRKYHGLLIALPGVDNNARKFYRRHIRDSVGVSTQLYEEVEVLSCILDSAKAVRPDVLARRISRNIGKPGDGFLLYTLEGLYWFIHINGPDEESLNRAILFDVAGNMITDKSTKQYLTRLFPEIEAFDTTIVKGTAVSQPSLFADAAEIVALNGSLKSFDYRRAVSPEHFVGRQSALDEIESFLNSVVNKRTASRGMVIDAPAGWGKSSLLLTAAARLKEKQHFAMAFDTRSASSPQYVQRVLNHAILELEKSEKQQFTAISPVPGSGFEPVLQTVLEFGSVLEQQQKLLVIFFDQLENIFFRQDILQRFRELYLKVTNAQTNVVLGFSWRSGPLNLTGTFSGSFQKTFTGLAKPIVLNPFSKREVHLFLQKLQKELKEPLRKDLRFLLAEFSRGYPWLLKRLCAEVVTLRQSGISQASIVRRQLSHDRLFQEDLSGLPKEAVDVLRHIAASAPKQIPEAAAEYDAQILSHLVDSGLMTRTGNTYDIYREDFRIFLTDGFAPVRENYFLFSKVDEALKASEVLQKAKGSLNMLELQARADFSSKTCRQVIRDMELLGLAKEDHGKVFLQTEPFSGAQNFELCWRRHIKKKLQDNRTVEKILKKLKQTGMVTIGGVSEQLQNLYPFVATSERNWRVYARILAHWMDAADLAIWVRKNQALAHLDPDTEIRERYLVLPRRRGARAPKIQYSPVENVAVRLVLALQKGDYVDWSGLKKSTIFSSLATLEDLGFIRRNTQLIKILPRGYDFVTKPSQRSRLFADGALQLKSFATFVEILRTHEESEKTLLQLGLELQEKLGKNWKKSTAEAIAKIMLDWARHTKLAPGVFGRVRRGPIKGRRKEDFQLPLFSKSYR